MGCAISINKKNKKSTTNMKLIFTTNQILVDFVFVILVVFLVVYVDFIMVVFVVVFVFAYVVVIIIVVVIAVVNDPIAQKH